LPLFVPLVQFCRRHFFNPLFCNTSLRAIGGRSCPKPMKGAVHFFLLLQIFIASKIYRAAFLRTDWASLYVPPLQSYGVLLLLFPPCTFALRFFFVADHRGASFLSDFFCARDVFSFSLRFFFLVRIFYRGPGRPAARCPKCPFVPFELVFRRVRADLASRPFENKLERSSMSAPSFSF